MRCLLPRYLFLLVLSVLCVQGCQQSAKATANTQTNAEMAAASLASSGKTINSPAVVAAPVNVDDASLAAIPKGQLHFIIVADTQATGGISKGVRVDLQNMRRLMKTLEYATGFKLQKKEFVDAFSTRAVEEYLKSLSLSSNDIVLFYYSGHGYNNQLIKSRFPVMQISDGGRLALDDVVNWLHAKSPRLLVAISDSCNREKFPGYADSNLPESRDTGENRYSLFRRLFLGQTGTIIMSASSVNEYAFSYDEKGGVFTHAWLSYLEKNAPLNATWADVKAKMEQPLEIKGSQREQNFQTPQVEIIASAAVATQSAPTQTVVMSPPEPAVTEPVVSPASVSPASVSTSVPVVEQSSVSSVADAGSLPRSVALNIHFDYGRAERFRGALDGQALRVGDFYNIAFNVGQTAYVYIFEKLLENQSNCELLFPNELVKNPVAPHREIYFRGSKGDVLEVTTSDSVGKRNLYAVAFDSEVKDMNSLKCGQLNSSESISFSIVK